ncbi:MAG: Glycine betaine transport system permease protein OpuAB, partial [Pseudomonadota bacterium]
MGLTSIAKRIALALAAVSLSAGLAWGADSRHPQCQTVRMSDIGWTDVTATTAVTSVLLEELGYKTTITVLSVPVTYSAMKNRDIDLFLGNWMPSMEQDRAPFLKDGSVEVVRANLTGAKYTLAVPAYLYDAGLKDFSDIARFGDALGHRIVGLEAGNDGNRQVLSLIAKNAKGLGGFSLVESSEQGMLAELERAVRDKRPIVFLGWEPHPMNTRFQMRYLTGGDDSFGPNFGGATIYTNTRAGYSAECPNVGRLLKNLSFTLADESLLMGAILDDHQEPKAAAKAWIAKNPQTVARWLEGVQTYNGQALKSAASPAPSASGTQSWVTAHKLPIGQFMTDLVERVKTSGRGFFDGVSFTVRGAVDGLTGLLKQVPPLVLLIAVAGLAYLLQRSWRLTLFVAAALLLIMNQGYWEAMLETLSLVLFSTLISTLIGVPLGVAAAHRPWLYRALHPVLDLMQTLPTFVYLIPTLVLFGLGVVPGLISTIIFALPAPVRLTHLGISSTPKPLIEAGEAFGATRWQ